MSSPRDASDPQAHSERVRPRTSAGETVAADTANPADAHLDSVPSDRIRLLTSELQRTGADAGDPSDAVRMKLLLTDYSVALGHLRAVARMSAAMVDGAAAPMRELDLGVHRHLKSVDALVADWLARDNARR